jgi:hypothetical protein
MPLHEISTIISNSVRDNEFNYLRRSAIRRQTRFSFWRQLRACSLVAGAFANRHERNRMRKTTSRATAYCFTTVVANDPKIAYAVELLRRDSTAVAELRHMQTTTPIVFEAEQRDDLAALSEQLRGRRISLFVDYDKSTPLPTAVIVMPTQTTTRRRYRRARAA